MLVPPPKRAWRATLQCLLMVFIAGFLAAPISEAASVVLAWDPSPDPQVIGYNVYRSESLGSFAVSALNGSTLVSQPTFTDSTGESNRTYYYVVTAVNVWGHESVPSTTVEATTPQSGGGTGIGTNPHGGAPVTTYVSGDG